MKTSNKILIIAFGILVIISILNLLKISSFIELKTFELSGIVETKEFSLDSFTILSAEKGLQINLEQSNKNKLTATADTIILNYLNVEVVDNQLLLWLDRRIPDSLRLEVNLKAIELNELKIKNGAKLYGKKTFIKDTLSIKGNSGGNVNMNLNLQHLYCDVNSGAKLLLSGESKSLDAEVTSGGQIRADKLVVEDAITNASSGGQLYVFVSNTLDVKASSGGEIEYSGNPTVTAMNVSSGGKVNKKRD